MFLNEWAILSLVLVAGEMYADEGFPLAEKDAEFEKLLGAAADPPLFVLVPAITLFRTIAEPESWYNHHGPHLLHRRISKLYSTRLATQVFLPVKIIERTNLAQILPKFVFHEGNLFELVD